MFVARIEHKTAIKEKLRWNQRYTWRIWKISQWTANEVKKKRCTTFEVQSYALVFKKLRSYNKRSAGGFNYL